MEELSDYHNVKNADEFLSKCGYDDPKHPLHNAKANIATLMDVYHAAMNVKSKFQLKPKSIVCDNHKTHISPQWKFGECVICGKALSV